METSDDQFYLQWKDYDWISEKDLHLVEFKDPFSYIYYYITIKTKYPFLIQKAADFGFTFVNNIPEILANEDDLKYRSDWSDTCCSWTEQWKIDRTELFDFKCENYTIAKLTVQTCLKTIDKEKQIEQYTVEMYDDAFKVISGDVPFKFNPETGLYQCSIWIKYKYSEIEDGRYQLRRIGHKNWLCLTYNQFTSYKIINDPTSFELMILQECKSLKELLSEKDKLIDKLMINSQEVVWKITSEKVYQ